ncbi:MAG TPA: phosphodiester glycosidase family protein [Desulfosporosinus sp.]|nr:phosphodiester glycosidase family protein [Desulfosporosinus sp.]
MKTKRTKRIKTFLVFLGFNLFFSAILAPFILFWGPFQSLKAVVVGSVYTSRHPQVVQIFLSQAEIDRIMNSNAAQGISGNQAIARTNVIADASSGITIEDINGPSFKGKVMLIKDPKRVKVAITKEIGVTGERVSDLVKDMGAIAGINAGGFYDPNGKGNGAFPDGLTVHDGKLVHNNAGTIAKNIAGFDDQGKLVIGNITVNQLEEKHIREAVTFGPNLIVDSKPVISGDGGWGIAPRTGIGQMADGTVIFVVIDGRQPTWSIGATLRDLMNVLVDYQAVNAVNLDGGSSSELVYNGKVLNRLWNIFGERYLPTAFVVTP